MRRRRRGLEARACDGGLLHDVDVLFGRELLGCVRRRPQPVRRAAKVVDAALVCELERGGAGLQLGGRVFEDLVRVRMYGLG